MYLETYLEISRVDSLRIELAVCMLLNAARMNGKKIYKTHVLKYLCFLEGNAVRTFANHMFPLRYKAGEYGPVPADVADFIENQGQFRNLVCEPGDDLATDREKTIYFEIINCNVDFTELGKTYFSEAEIAIINETVAMMMKIDNVRKLSMTSHAVMKSWLEGGKTCQERGCKSAEICFGPDALSHNQDDCDAVFAEHAYKIGIVGKVKH